MLADGGLTPVFVDSLVEVSTCIADITSLTLVTLEMVDDFLSLFTRADFLFQRFQIIV